MSLLIDSRPGQVLYNVEVTLRMVDQLLAELGGDPLPFPAGSGDRTVTDRVTYALMLVESLGTEEASSYPQGNPLHERLRSELKTLLRTLHGQAHREAAGSPTGSFAELENPGAAPTSWTRG